jgi:hypothetical protein
VDFNPCYRGVMVTGSGSDITSPVVDVHMFHERPTLPDLFREKDVVLEQV